MDGETLHNEATGAPDMWQHLSAEGRAEWTALAQEMEREHAAGRAAELVMYGSRLAVDATTRGAKSMADTGYQLDAARIWLINEARQQAVHQPELAEGFNALVRELLEAPTSGEEFAAMIRRTRPQYAHTLEWDECPDDWNRECYCATCLEAAQ